MVCNVVSAEAREKERRYLVGLLLLEQEKAARAPGTSNTSSSLLTRIQYTTQPESIYGSFDRTKTGKPVVCNVVRHLQ